MRDRNINDLLDAVERKVIRVNILPAIKTASTKTINKEITVHVLKVHGEEFASISVASQHLVRSFREKGVVLNNLSL